MVPLLPLTSLLCVRDMEVTRVPLTREEMLVGLLPCCACHASRWLPCTHHLLFLAEPGEVERKWAPRRPWGTKDGGGWVTGTNGPRQPQSLGCSPGCLRP